MQYIQGLFQEIAALLLSILTLFGGVVTPSTNQILKNIAPDTVIDFVVTGDTQVCDYMPAREANLISLSEDINNSDIELDAFIIVGDVTENGMVEEFDRISGHIKDFNVKNYIMAPGNHDIRLRSIDQAKERFFGFMNSLNAEENAQNEMYYKYMVEDYTFLVIGSDDAAFEEASISDAQLQWLNIELKEATKSGKPVFVLCHYPLAESHGLPGTWGSSNSDDVTGQLPTYVAPDDPDYTGSIGKQSQEVYDILCKYENVIFITGHLHTGFGKNSYQVISEENNVIGINVPSVGIDNKDGAYNNPGTGYFVEVTPDAVYFHARDFALGKNVTDWDIVVDIK